MCSFCLRRESPDLGSIGSLLQPIPVVAGVDDQERKVITVPLDRRLVGIGAGGTRLGRQFLEVDLAAGIHSIIGRLDVHASSGR